MVTNFLFSAWQGHLEMVELLVSAGAEVNAVDNDRRTPLQSASWQGHGEIVRLLCERGSKIDHTCNQVIFKQVKVFLNIILPSPLLR